jgi:arylsulfatase A-like enzyme
MPTSVASGFLGVADNAIVVFTSDNGAETLIGRREAMA